MIAPQPLQVEHASGDFYFAAESHIAPMWPAQNTDLWRCLSMLIAGIELTNATFKKLSAGKLDRLVYVLRGLGWPVMSHVAPSVDEKSDESKLSYFIGDADKRVILEGEE